MTLFRSPHFDCDGRVRPGAGGPVLQGGIVTRGEQIFSTQILMQITRDREEIILNKKRIWPFLAKNI